MYRKDRNDVHGRPVVDLFENFYTYGQPCASFPSYLCTRPCTILFTAGRVHSPVPLKHGRVLDGVGSDQ